MQAGLNGILEQLAEKQENQEKSSYRTSLLSTFLFVQIPAQNKIIITKSVMKIMVILQIAFLEGLLCASQYDKYFMSINTSINTFNFHLSLTR